MNIKFNYLYRDGSNYKKWADVVFSNEDGLTANAVTQNLRIAFLADGLFIAHQVRIPEVFFWLDEQLDPDDHCFHEFAAAEATSDAPNDAYGRSIREFIADVAAEAVHEWPAFNPQDRLPHRRA